MPKKLNIAGFNTQLKKSKKKAILNVTEQDVQDVPGYGHTQGSRSGHKMKRINILITPENHAFLSSNAKQNLMPISKFLNQMLNRVQDVQDVNSDYRVMDNAASRINMAFSDRNYSFLKNNATALGISPSSLINQLIEQERGA